MNTVIYGLFETDRALYSFQSEAIIKTTPSIIKATAWWWATLKTKRE